MSWLPYDPLTRFIARLMIIMMVARVLSRFACRRGQPLVVTEIIADAGFVVPFALGAPIALRLAPLAGPRGNANAFALVVVMAFAITTFPVLARVRGDNSDLRS